MTVSLELRPEVEASLQDQAKAKGVPLHAYLQDLIEHVARAQAVPKPDAEEFRTALDRLAETGRSLPQVPSSAFRRENIYEGHN